MTPDRHLGWVTHFFKIYLILDSTCTYIISLYSFCSAAWIDKCRPDILISESTYATTIRDSKRCRERDFLKKVHESIERGGKVRNTVSWMNYMMFFFFPISSSSYTAILTHIGFSFLHALCFLMFSGSYSSLCSWKSTGTLHPVGDILVGSFFLFSFKKQAFSVSLA